MSHFIEKELDKLFFVMYYQKTLLLEKNIMNHIYKKQIQKYLNTLLKKPEEKKPKDWYSVCDLNSLCKLLSIDYHHTPEYKFLNGFHMKYWNDIDDDCLETIMETTASLLNKHRSFNVYFDKDEFTVKELKKRTDLNFFEKLAFWRTYYVEV